jgi:hypothetical protein
MGLFSKLGKSMHGGVTLKVQAPGSVNENQMVPITVTITSEETHTVSSVKAEIYAQEEQRGVSFGNNGVGVGMGGGVGIGMGNNNNDMGMNNNRSYTQTVAQVESREAFTINPGETKVVNLQLYIDAGVTQKLSGGGGAVAGAIGALVSAAQTLENIHFIYSVHASAHVDGVKLHPSDHMPIQVLPPISTTLQQPTATPQFNNAATVAPPVVNPQIVNPAPAQPTIPPTPQNNVGPDDPNNLNTPS